MYSVVDSSQLYLPSLVLFKLLDFFLLSLKSENQDPSLDYQDKHLFAML